MNIYIYIIFNYMSEGSVHHFGNRTWVSIMPVLVISRGLFLLLSVPWVSLNLSIYYYGFIMHIFSAYFLLKCQFCCFLVPIDLNPSNKSEWFLLQSSQFVWITNLGTRVKFPRGWTHNPYDMYLNIIHSISDLLNYNLFGISLETP